MATNRLEAFSDGVIAIAITLLVLDIHVPDPGRGDLGRELGHQWPSYVAYVVSFATIGIVWINHHVAIARLARVNHAVLVLNLVLLLTIGLLPFTTALMAAYLRDPSGEHLAAGVYAGSFLLLGCSFFVLHAYALGRRTELLRDPLTRELRRAIIRRNATGVIPYALAVAIAPVSAYATLALCGAVALFYAVPAFTPSEPRADAGGAA